MITDNLAGHRNKYNTLKSLLPAADVGREYVGGGDPLWTGYNELELIRSYANLFGAFVVDIGCGIGRLTRHLLHEDIARYLGTDILPEIMAEAIDCAAGDPRFEFAINTSCAIPAETASANVVVAYSVITHLRDEETFEYFADSRRVLKPGGVAIFSFLDMLEQAHVDLFFTYAAYHRQGHGDLMKFQTKAVLSMLATKAGFSQVNFVGPAQELATSGKASPLIERDYIPFSFAFGQSVCVLGP
jgi:2-polyprenyl-3-methyl-5-hydroxy-6-metoxy-1,4-benzoquinol methylase